MVPFGPNVFARVSKLVLESQKWPLKGSEQPSNAQVTQRLYQVQVTPKELLLDQSWVRMALRDHSVLF